MKNIWLLLYSSSSITLSSIVAIVTFHPQNQLPPDSLCSPILFSKNCAEPIDGRLVRKIKELCQDGVTGEGNVRSHLKTYIKEICNPLPHLNNKRFYPSDKNIGNHMFTAGHSPVLEEQDQMVSIVSADYSIENVFVQEIFWKTEIVRI